MLQRHRRAGWRRVRVGLCGSEPHQTLYLRLCRRIHGHVVAEAVALVLITRRHRGSQVPPSPQQRWHRQRRRRRQRRWRYPPSRHPPRKSPSRSWRAPRPSYILSVASSLSGWRRGAPTEPSIVRMKRHRRRFHQRLRGRYNSPRVTCRWCLCACFTSRCSWHRGRNSPRLNVSFLYQYSI